MKICNICGYIGNDNDAKCLICDNNNWTDWYENELRMLSSDEEFLTSMKNLKLKDPIEYHIKLKQLGIQSPIEKAKSNQMHKNIDNQPRCPKCGSTAITSGARGVNLTWGIIGASKTVNRCGHCGHTWKPKK